LWLAHGADNSAVLVVPNLVISIEAEHSKTVLNIHELLWESFTFTSMCRMVMTSSQNLSIALICVVPGF
jgi:hypothetical protein